MRVSDSMQTDSILASLSSTENQLTAASQVATSGETINEPSDNPVAAAQLARVDASIAQSTAYQGAITNVQGDLNLTESSLASAVDVVNSAQQIALEASNGSVPASDLQSMAGQISQLQNQLLAIANQKGTNGYLFSGSQTATAAFSAAGVFQGDDTNRVAEVGPGNTAVVNVSGAQAFTAAGGVDVFASLTALQTALTNNDSAGISAGVSALTQASSQITAAESDAGIKLDTLTTAASVQQATQLSLLTAQNGLDAANPAEAYTQLQTMENAVQQAVDASRITLSTLSANRFG
jgi:flagellar hook-associated protein 3 FlgL